jgi:hypothetical protein
MDLPPKSFFAALVLIGLNAAFWLTYALMVGMGLISSFAAYPVLRWIMAILALGTFLCLTVLTLLLFRHNRLAFYPGAAMFAAIAVLSILDEVGVADLIMLGISLPAAGLMWKDRAWYLRGRGSSPGAA